MHILEELMQCMTKLMEHCTCLVGSEQCRFAGSWFGEVAHDGDHGSNLLALLVGLVAIGATPCSATFRGAGVEVHEENGYMLALGVLHLKCLCLGVGQWHVLYLSEGDAI